MQKSLEKMLSGYHEFRRKYALGDQSIMQSLSQYGQQPEIMVVACCDARVDPALILQCDPGDLFVVRNVANIIPPFERDEAHHGTSAALEFGVQVLGIKHLILLGHSQCGGIQALAHTKNQSDFIHNWVSLVKTHEINEVDHDEYAKLALRRSHENCLTFPWIKEKIMQNDLFIHLWFFDIKTGQIFKFAEDSYQALQTHLS